MSCFKNAVYTAAVFSTFSPVVHGSELSEVVVTATRQATRVDEVLSDITVIDRSTIEQTGGESIIDLLAQQPGIQAMQNGGPGTNAEIFIRGSRSTQTKILVDGMPINSMDLTGSPLRFLPLADVERIEILRGPASSLYGADAIGGVIQVFTRRGSQGLRSNAYAGFGSYGTQTLSTGISGGNEQWHFRLSGNDFRTDGISAVRNGRNRDGDNDPSRTMGVNGNISFSPVTGHEFSFSGMRNHGQTFFDSTSGTGSFNSRIDFANEVWSLASKNTLSDTWTSTLRYGKSLDDQTSYTSATPSVLITEGTQTNWQNDIKLPLGTGLILFDRQEQQAGPKNRFPSKTETTDNALVLGWNAALSSHRWQLSSRRDQHNSFGTKNNWAVSYGYQFNDTLRLSTGASTSFKAPTLYQLYIASFGNAALVPETGRNREIALNWEQGQQTAGVVWYRNELTNMIDYSTTTSRYENISQAILQGWTLSWGGKVTDWSFSSSLDLLDARNKTLQQALERRAKEKLSLSASRNWGGWDTGVELISVGRRYNTATQTQPLGGYTVVNITARYALTREWALELRGNNLTDKQYATAQTTSSPYLYYNTPGANYFLGLRYEMK